MLQEAIAKINELASILQQSINKYAMAVKEIDARAFKLAESEKAVEAKEWAISKRENKVKPIEHIVQYHDEAIALKEEANKLYAKLREEREAFNLSASAKQDQINALTRDANIMKAKADKENVMLQKEWEVLNKEKVEYKDNLLKEIQTRIG